MSTVQELSVLLTAHLKDKISICGIKICHVMKSFFFSDELVIILCFLILYKKDQIKNLYRKYHAKTVSGVCSQLSRKTENN